MTKRIHREDAEQKALIQWADLTPMPGRMRKEKIGKYLFAIPNGGARGKTEAARLVGLGVRRGVADLFLMVAVEPFHGLFIEMKAPKPHSSPVSTFQKLFHARAVLNDYASRTCYGFDEASAVILWYLDGSAGRL